MTRLIVSIIIFLVFGLTSCVKDKPNPTETQLPNSTHKGVVICNEGLYGNNNGEISFFDQENLQVYNQLYRLANENALGDVVQSISLINGNYFFVINASHKLVVVDPFTFQLKTIITGCSSPRYIKQVSNNKAYITSLYHDDIYVLNLLTLQIEKKIKVDIANTENMYVQGSHCYVTNWDTASPYIYKIDILNDSIVKRIELGCKASHDIIADTDGKLWILSGNKYKNKSSFLTCYDLQHDSIVQQFSFANEFDPIRLSCNKAKDTLYFISVNYDGNVAANGVYKLGIHEIALPTQPFIQAQSNSYFWALGIDESNGHIFLSDPKGFTQQSTVFEYLANGKLVQQFQAGIGANQFLFKP